MVAPVLTVQQQGQATVSADQLNTMLQTADNVVQLRAFVGAPGVMVFVRGTVTPGDGGGGAFWWNPSVIATDNGVSIIVPQPTAPGAWLICPVQYGAVPAELQNLPIAFSWPGQPSPLSQIQYPIVQNTVIPANFAGAQSYVGTNPAASAVFSLSYVAAGVKIAIGGVTISTAGAVTYSSGAAVALIPGNTLIMDAPSVQDATLQNVGITILAQRQ